MKNPEIGMVGVQKTFEVVGKRKHSVGGKEGVFRLKYGTSKDREYVTMLLGGKLKKDPMPSDHELDRLLNAIGFVGTNQIEKILGQPALHKIIKAIESGADV